MKKALTALWVHTSNANNIGDLDICSQVGFLGFFLSLSTVEQVFCLSLSFPLCPGWARVNTLELHSPHPAYLRLKNWFWIYISAMLLRFWHPVEVPATFLRNQGGRCMWNKSKWIDCLRQLSLELSSSWLSWKQWEFSNENNPKKN